jgi:hypothetical protein
MADDIGRIETVCDGKKKIEKFVCGKISFFSHFYISFFAQLVADLGRSTFKCQQNSSFHETKKLICISTFYSGSIKVQWKEGKVVFVHEVRFIFLHVTFD